jgi:hypothetical protein
MFCENKVQGSSTSLVMMERRQRAAALRLACFWGDLFRAEEQCVVGVVVGEKEEKIKSAIDTSAFCDSCAMSLRTPSLPDLPTITICKFLHVCGFSMWCYQQTCCI